MKAMDAADLEERLGADRVIDPAGSLPQPAERLDPAGPVRRSETEIAVERLCLDSTSLRQIRESSGSDPALMSDRILGIVAERGKMHNPHTDSGGVLCGTVTATGELVERPAAIGERVVTLCSLTLTPLRLERVTELDPGSAHVGVIGTAYVPDAASIAPMPDDLPAEVAIDLFDVCAAASQVRELAPRSGTIAVLGAGHAGKLAMAAARDASPEATIVAVDVDAAELERLADVGLCDTAVAADLRDPLAAIRGLRAAGVEPSALTVVVVNASGCESAAVLQTAPGGSVLFFSMATSFSAAALAADGIGTDVRMLVGSGHSVDHGDYALGLVRRDGALREAIGLEGAAG